MTRPNSRLIVSFIGRADLRSVGLGDAGAEPVRSDDGLGPILRLLDYLTLRGLCRASDTSLLLFDDRPTSDVRRKFCNALRARLPGMGIDAIPVRLHPMDLPAGPTDLNALYYAVWSAIPGGDGRPEEVIFHLSSGTPAMQVTLLLAANCLPLKKARLFETSVEQKAIEIAPPYVIATRENKAVRSRDRSTLSQRARDALLKLTVVDDPLAEAAYATLYKAATRKDSSVTVLIQGPTGSGKWHAAEQFAAWRGGGSVQSLLPPVPSAPTAAASVLIRRLDAWPAQALTGLGAWRVAHPDIAVVGTFRTDVNTSAPLDVIARDGLVGAELVSLPALGARTDVVKLAEAVTERSGIWDGKIKQRLQYELLTDVYPRGLHDLISVLRGAASRSKGEHPERAGYLEAKQLADAGEARALLSECFQVLAGLAFGKGRLSLAQVMSIIEAVVVQSARAEGRKQSEVAELLGCSQQHVANVLRQKIRLSDWHTQLTPNDEAL